MKFGKRLQLEAERGDARYRPFFIDYKALKLSLKQDIEFQDAKGTGFEQTLHRELNKVAAFYEDCEQQLEATMAQVISVPSSASVTEVKIQLQSLHKYAVLNYIAVVKAVKKRNRHLQAWDPVGFKPMKASVVLQQQYFYTSLKLAALTTRANILANETASPAAPVSQILEEYTCPVCLTLLRSPVVLSCAHLICWACLLAHCSAVKQLHESIAHNGDNEKLMIVEMEMEEQQQQADDDHEESKRDSSTRLTVSAPARWVGEGSTSDEEESCTVATFACPCCRKDQLMDLDILQVDPHLDSFLLKLEQNIDPNSEATADNIDALLIDFKQQQQQQQQNQIQQQQPVPIPAPFSSKQIVSEDAVAVIDSAMLDDEDIESQSSSLAAAVAASESDAVMEEIAVAEVPAHRRTEPPLLPPQSLSSKGKMTVCLDLDGTLVTTFTPKRAPLLPSTAAAYIVGRGGKLNPSGIFVVERPGLGEFLHRAAAVAEVVIFTAGLEDYAAPILDALEHRYGEFEHRLYRPATVHNDVYPCVKDLSRLGRDLRRCVLVDDTPLAFFHQPDNGVPVLQYRGDVDDRLLTEAVAPMLEALAALPDVTAPLSSRFNMRSWFASQGLPVQPRSSTAVVPAVSALHRVPSAPVVSAIAAPRQNLKGSGRKPPMAPRPFKHHSPGRASALSAAEQADATPNVMLVFDFDQTLLEYDAGERVCDELAPELTSLLAQMESPANFVPATNSVLSEMQRRGISRDQLIRTLRTMGQEMPKSSVSLLQWAGERKLDVRVLSDCNSLFIHHMLAAAEVHTCVTQVITNTASFEKAPGNTTGQRLVIQPRHDHKALGSHGCPLCPSNLCKGQELSAIRSTAGRIIYAGDGANDLCPALCLGAEDVILARAGYPLDTLLKSGKHQVEAAVQTWSTHGELFEMVKAAVHEFQ